MKSNIHLKTNARRAGFSLAELMVVIVIIGLLGTVVAPKLLAKFGKAQIGTAKADVIRISDACTDFYLDNNRYPESLEQLVTEDDTGSKYLDSDRVPTDPWGNEYTITIEDGEPLIWCLGKDGAQGGDGDDRDFNQKMIKNKEI